MTETFTPTLELNVTSRAHKIMEHKLGSEGVALLEGQLARWQELNERELHSPLRDSLLAGNTTLPEGTLLHSTGMHKLFNVEALEGIARMGVVSGELRGMVEDSETHGCADFFRVPTDMPAGDYIKFAKESVSEGRLRVQRGERMVARGVTVIIDPEAEGMDGLLQHDGYRDPAMQDFVRPPAGRTAEDTAAILGGVPRGAVAGLLVSETLFEKPEVQSALPAMFPGLPVIGHSGQRLA